MNIRIGSREEKTRKLGIVVLRAGLALLRLVGLRSPFSAPLAWTWLSRRPSLFQPVSSNTLTSRKTIQPSHQSLKGSTVAAMSCARSGQLKLFHEEVETRQRRKREREKGKDACQPTDSAEVIPQDVQAAA